MTNTTRILTVICGVLLALVVSAPAQTTKSFPAHWGPPPKIQTMDYVQLPGGYGNGSSTLAKWIERNLEKDRQSAGGGQQAPAIFSANFETNQPGKLPEDFLILDGAFEIKEDGGNKFIELPGAPLETYGLLFGPAQTNDIAVGARVQSTTKGRRYPVFGVGLSGVGGYKLLLAPAKGELELFKGDERVTAAKCGWKSGAWTQLRLQLRKVGAGEWRVEGKAWPDGAADPKAWMISYAEKTEPIGGRATIWGSPFSGQPIRFDDLSVRSAGERP